MAEKQNSNQEHTYRSKAIEMAQEYSKKQQKISIKDRERLYGLQIVPKATYYDDSKGHVPGEKNWKRFGFDLHPQGSLIAGGLVLLFILLTFIYKEQAVTFFSGRPGRHRQQFWLAVYSGGQLFCYCHDPVRCQ